MRGWAARAADAWDEMRLAAGLASSDAPRPCIPPILQCALCFWAAAAAAYAVSWRLGFAACALAAVICAVPVLGALAGMEARRVLVGIAGGLLGLLCGFAGSAAHHHTTDALENGVAGTFSFVMREDARASLFGLQGVAETALPDGRSVTVLVYFDGDEVFSYGDSFRAEARLEPAAEGSRERLWQQGVHATANVDACEALPASGPAAALLRLRATAVRALSGVQGDEGALLAALVCNDRRALDEGTLYDSYRVTGLAHIVAVSGSHLAIVGSCLGVAVRAAGLPRAAAVIVQGVLAAAYLVFSAAPVSAVRAVMVSVAGLSSYFARRRSAPLNALGICVFALVAPDPATALSASFVLSMGSTLGIVLVAGLAEDWVSRAAPLPRGIVQALSLTVAAGFATMPYSAALFAQASLVSPAANVVAAPLFALVCSLGIVAACFSFVAEWAPVPGEMLLACGLEAARLAAWLLNEAVGVLAAFPHAGVPADLPVSGGVALSAGLVVLLWKTWPRFGGAAVRALCAATAVVVAAVLAFPRADAPEIVMLDVGQGDALLVRSEGFSLLVDTGTNDALLLQALARHGVTRLDAVAVTHGDDDHCGSLPALRGVVAVERVLVAADALACPCASCAPLVTAAANLVGEDGIVGLRQGDTLRADGVTVTTLWPRSFADEGGNADSLVLHVAFDADGDACPEAAALLCGDAEVPQLSRIISEYALGRTDIVKVGHHGSRGALDAAVCAALAPRIALVSVGEGNRYGHPSEEVLSLLYEQGAAVLRTDLHGDVSCRLDSGRLRVETQR